MDPIRDPELLDWLSAPANPPVRYLTARDLIKPPPATNVLVELRGKILDWEPLQQILDRQLEGGSFPLGQKTVTAQPIFTALNLMQRCGLAITDEPVSGMVDYLTEHHLAKGALSYTTGGSGILPCYLGVVAANLIGLGGLDTEIVQTALRWLIDHQRFDHKDTRAGGNESWPYAAPRNYGCWKSVSCYHGVAGAFQAFAAVPRERRTGEINARLAEAVEYLRIHRVYKKSSADRPLFRHMTQFFLVGDYRSDLLDMLQGLADADPRLIREAWVAEAVQDMQALAPEGRVLLVKNYGKRLIDPIPLEPLGEPSRFLTYQWLKILRAFDGARSTV
jgi:hypothetical protein